VAVKIHDTQSIEIDVAPDRAFELIADARALPRWTAAFAEADEQRARLRTPMGEVDIRLRVNAEPITGTVDWHMTFADGSEAVAYSRVLPLAPDRCVYSFVLMPPPVPLEALEGALEEQSRTLASELVRLKEVLEDRDA
jgi:hypothetical protein